MESSHEHTEQKLPGSTASANANYNPIVQDNNDGDQLPAIVIPGDDQEEAIHQSFQDPITLHDAAKVAFRRYWTNGQVANLNQAVEYWHKALKLTPPNSPNRPALQNNLAIALQDRYKHTGNLTDLEAAIDFIQQAVQTTPSDSPNLPARLSNLTIGLRDRYMRTGNRIDLEAAISASRQAIQATPVNSPDLPRWQNNLGMVLSDRYT